ncbi:hypothetical protein PRUPE_2G031100 [Prunus persica]|uniref:Secreted protein n=1 Tax=Prunus persica TaxID=3760 RepID=A0A251QDH4_PRUPE|nr:hypothetical protein PRUPE_2G031100 [Prunus persica]
MQFFQLSISLLASFVSKTASSSSSPALLLTRWQTSILGQTKKIKHCRLTSRSRRCKWRM